MVPFRLSPVFLLLPTQARLESNPPELCLTEACVTQTADLLDQMDRTQDPCQDFYQFSCGGYIQDTVLPPHKTNTGSVGGQDCGDIMYCYVRKV